MSVKAEITFTVELVKEIHVAYNIYGELKRRFVPQRTRLARQDLENLQSACSDFLDKHFGAGAGVDGKPFPFFPNDETYK